MTLEQQVRPFELPMAVPHPLPDSTFRLAQRGESRIGLRRSRHPAFRHSVGFLVT
jgi:hypothetical protein